MLQSGQVDAVIGYSFTSFIDLKSMNVPVNDLVVLLMSDYGVDLYGNTVMVSQKLAAEKPEAVKGFLRAFLKGLRDTVKDPSTAIGAVAAHSDPARKPIELERLRMALKDNVLTPEVKANGYGAVDLDRLGRAIGQIAQTYDFKNKPKAADVFDASFLPPDAERKAR
jgi:NitT/TauT family transport system substrate-binding protein